MLNLQRIHLKNHYYQIDILPSEPALLTELIDLCHNDDASFEMFAEAIGKDTALAAKILQVANSPIYRQWNDSTDIRRFLIVLGLSNVRQIVISNAIQQFFAGFGRKFDSTLQFAWYRSLVCSSLAKIIAEYVGYEKPEEAFLAGLMHQVGQLLLLINQPKEYPPLLRKYYQADNFRQLEKENFGVDHCELGAALLESWRMDSFIADAILFQHSPIEDLLSAPLLLKILAVASPLSSVTPGDMDPSNLKRAGQLFNMTEASILECFSKALEQSKQMVETVGYNSDYFVEHNDNQPGQNELQQKAENRLAQRVKEIALSRSAFVSENGEIETLARSIRTVFSSLFGINSLFLLESDQKGSSLAPVNDLNLKQLSEMNLPTRDPKSLLAKSFNEKTRVSLQSGNGSIVDRQILRLLKTENGYAFPIHSGGVATGVLVLGIAAEETGLTEKKLPFIKLLIDELARSHRRIFTSRGRDPGISLSEFRKIAHEVSNPLTIIKNYLYTLGKKIDQNHPAQEEIQFINEEIERAGNILLRSKDPENFAGKTGKLSDINELIISLDKILRNSLYKTNNIESFTQLDTGIPKLLFVEDKLKQVLINLLKNAVEAMPDGGSIQISTRDHFFQNGLEYVEIALKDNGPGIPQEVLRNLFKPVESTKQGHSGLGLSIVRNLVSELVGNISCYSNPAFGTEFKILIPRNTKRA